MSCRIQVGWGLPSATTLAEAAAKQARKNVVQPEFLDLSNGSLESPVRCLQCPKVVFDRCDCKQLSSNCGVQPGELVRCAGQRSKAAGALQSEKRIKLGRLPARGPRLPPEDVEGQPFRSPRWRRQGMNKIDGDQSRPKYGEVVEAYYRPRRALVIRLDVAPRTTDWAVEIIIKCCKHSRRLE